MHSIARSSSFGSLSPGSGALAYPFHHSPSFGPAHQSLSEPSTPSEPVLPPTVPNVGPSLEAYPIPSSSRAPPARGCLKAPTKEFVTKCEPAEPESQLTASSSARPAPGTRRRPNMKLERVSSNAIARIQQAEGVEPHVAERGGNATGSEARGKCKERVPTPYVKSGKSSWLSDGEEE